MSHLILDPRLLDRFDMHMVNFHGLFLVLVLLANGLLASVIYVDDEASPGGDGLSWAAALPTIQEAVAVAVAGDEIWVAEGVYQPDTPSGSIEIDKELSVYGGFDGTENFLTERDSNPNTNSSVITGKNGLMDDASDNIAIPVRMGGSEGLFDGFRLERAGFAGIGLLSEDAPTTLVIRNCSFVANVRALRGTPLPLLLWKTANSFRTSKGCSFRLVLRTNE